MKREYVLKHKDIDVAEFGINKLSGKINYLEIFDDKFSPVNSKEDKISQIGSFNDWLSDRCIPNSRDGVERLKSKYKVSDVKQIMLYMYGLSLSDHYWIDRSPFNNKWNEINLFENRYDELMGNMLFDKRLKLVKSSENYGFRNPDVTTGGSLKKCWRYNEKDNKSYLLKWGSKKEYQEPFNEYFTHLLLSKIGIYNTPYSLEKIGNEYVSVCPCIADIKKEMVNAVDLRRKYGIKEKSYDDFVGIGIRKGCMGFKDDVNKMIVCDFLIDNIDRHWYNFGILRESETGKWDGLIPLYDNGYSLWNKDFVDSKILSESMSFADSNEECLKYFHISDYLRNVPDMVSIFDEAFEKYENTERKIELRKGIAERMEDIKKIIDDDLIVVNKRSEENSNKKNGGRK